MQPRFTRSSSQTPETGDAGASQYWEGVDTEVAQVVEMMDQGDTWHLETEAQFRQNLDALITKIVDSPQVAHYSLDHPDRVVELLGWMKTSSAMMLLHYSTDDKRDVIERFTQACQTLLKTQPNDEAACRAATVAIDRFLTFERLAMLRRLFSTERAQAIEKAVAQASTIVRFDTTTDFSTGGQP